MGRAAFCQIHPPVRARRDRLQTELAGRRDDDGERSLGIHIALTLIVAGETRQAVALQLDDLGSERRDSLEDGAAMLPVQRRWLHKHALGPPELGCSLL